ncbi:hypothetical protein EON65_31900 [archaeon]|nr:MAG: hypothetical protein EON65_31900 [archaeon]
MLFFTVYFHSRKTKESSQKCARSVSVSAKWTKSNANNGETKRIDSFSADAAINPVQHTSGRSSVSAKSIHKPSSFLLGPDLCHPPAVARHE